MIRIDKTTSLPPIYSWQNTYPEENILFFDIETTGFSPDVSNVYLIGALYCKENVWHLIQWFADNYQSEKELLCSFFDFLKDYPLLVHYNGTGFDIPYLIKKCSQHQLSYNFHSVQSFDLYKKLQKIKKFLRLPDLKQPTVEKLSGYQRRDSHHGGELIEVYNQYMQNKILKRPFEDLYHMLLLHNQEDLFGLFYSVKLLGYHNLFHGFAELINLSVLENAVHISLSLRSFLPAPIRMEIDGIKFQGEDFHFEIYLPFFQGELKFFYSEYKDYYYLPAEDYAIHKSVAVFVDKAFKEKAKASNCYSKKNSVFLPQWEVIYTPYFQEAYKYPMGYFEWTPTVFDHKDTLINYIKHLLYRINIPS